MKVIQAEETEIIGKWIIHDGTVVGDETCDRIVRLTDNYLEKLDCSGDGWETLFRDPFDGRFWERWYPKSYMHGGGPPSLKLLTKTEARKKYPDLFSDSE